MEPIGLHLFSSTIIFKSSMGGKSSIPNSPLVRIDLQFILIANSLLSLKMKYKDILLTKLIFNTYINYNIEIKSLN